MSGYYPATCENCGHDFERDLLAGGLCQACRGATGPRKFLPILVSFSGGRTSAYMARRLIDSGFTNLFFVFANTGCEAEETLQFINRCATEWGINIVWIEAVTHPESRTGCTHRFVSFETASRNGEPYEEMIGKYGIPNKAYPHCTRELKLNPLKSYLSEIGAENVLRAVGIRADEPRRIGSDPLIWYPLFDWGVDKQDVNTWWEEQPFSLDLPEHRGNCVWCWKKSTPKLVRVARETPEVFAFPARMEREHGLSGHNVDGTRRVFFREHRSATDILISAISAESLPPVTDEDTDGGCSESCEAFAHG